MLNYEDDIFLPDVTSMVPLMCINSVCMFINSVCMSTYEDAADTSSNDNFANFLQSNVNVYHVNVMKSNNVSQVSYDDYTPGNI